MDLETAREILAGIDPVAAATNAAAIAVGIVASIMVLRLIRRRRPLPKLAAKYKPSRLDLMLTFAGATMASGMAAYTMWLAVGAQMPTWLKWGTITFVEINTVASAMRSRRFRLLYAQRVAGILADDPTAEVPPRDRDVDGLAVWIIAAGSALLGLVEAASAVEAIARTGAPLIAAFSWERALVGELRQYTTRKARTIRWINPLESAAVWLGWATPSDQHKSIAAADRSRRVGLVIDAGYRAGIPSPLPFKLNGVADALASRRYHRRLRAVQRRYGSGQALLAEIRLGVAALRQADVAVSDEQLTHLDPWGDPAADSKAAAEARAELEQAHAFATAQADQHARDLAAIRTELEQVRTAAADALDEANTRIRAASAELTDAQHRAANAERRAEEAAAAAGQTGSTLERLLAEARRDAAEARTEARQIAESARRDLARMAEQHAAELARLATARPGPTPPSGPSRSSRFTVRPTSPAPRAIEIPQIEGLPRFDPSTACGCGRLGKGTVCGWTLAGHIARKADEVKAVLAMFPDWATRPGRGITKSDVEAATGSSSSSVQNQVAWLFDQLRAIAQEQTTPV